MYSGTGGAQMFVAASTPATQLGTCAVGPPRRTKDSAAALKVQYFSLRRKLEQWDTRTTARGGGCCGLRVEKARRTSGERGSPIGTRETESIAASSLTRGTGSLCGEGWRGHSCGPRAGRACGERCSLGLNRLILMLRAVRALSGRGPLKVRTDGENFE